MVNLGLVENLRPKTQDPKTKTPLKITFKCLETGISNFEV